MPTQPETRQHIEEIINRSRHGDDNLLTNSRTATTDILTYLEENDLIHFPLPEIFITTALSA